MPRCLPVVVNRLRSPANVHCAHLARDGRPTERIRLTAIVKPCPDELARNKRVLCHGCPGAPRAALQRSFTAVFRAKPGWARGLDGSPRSFRVSIFAAIDHQARKLRVDLLEFVIVVIHPEHVFERNEALGSIVSVNRSSDRTARVIPPQRLFHSRKDSASLRLSALPLLVAHGPHND